MKVTVLSDNIGSETCRGEWGLSFHIEFNGKRFLLDTGGSGLFLVNAEKLGIDLSEVDYAILSHAHYDHSLGMQDFFQVNSKAKFYLSPSAGENCYGGLRFVSRYIGLPKGILTEYQGRIETPSSIAEISENVFVVPHSTEGLNRIGRRNHLYVKKGMRYLPDDFSHEQSLVFRTESGLVIFNSCSHSGADVIMDEVAKAFNGEPVKAYVGGLHLFRLYEREIREIAEKIRRSGLKCVYTGHCTGEKAYSILKEELGDTVHQFYCGMMTEI